MDDLKTLIHESHYRAIGYDPKNALPHHDKSIEIIQFWSDGGYFIAKNNIFPIKPGMIIIINALDIHYSNPSNIEKYNRSKLIVSTDCFQRICDLCALNEFYKSIEQTGGIMCQFDPKSEVSLKADSLFEKACHDFVHPPTPLTQAEIMDCVIRLLILLSQNKNKGYMNTSAEHTLQQMTNYINNQLLTWEDVSLKKICSELHISSSYASHLFKELTNKSITRYAMDLRISEAKKLLLTTDMKVFDIAELLKFKDSTTFCKTFKKYTGYTPRGYKSSEGVVLGYSISDTV